MKKIKVYNWIGYMPVHDKNGNYTGTRIVNNNSADLIKTMFDKIEKKPVGTENYKMVRKLVKATDPAIDFFNKQSKKMFEENKKKREEFQEVLNKRQKDNDPITKKEVEAFERSLRLETEIILDEAIYDFIMKNAFDKNIEATIGFDELTSDAIDAIIDAEDYITVPDENGESEDKIAKSKKK